MASAPAPGRLIPGEFLEELAAVRPFLQDDEEGVVPAQCTEDVGDLQEIDAVGDSRGVSHLGLHDGEIARRT